ncbi:hypothetical protein [Chromobacterium violaceum]|nr:hypothetical protein [Chromobacterium violaceum]OLZ74933.1 hypothetical protein BS642_20150 [Chromobacterium violaceum]
MMTKTDSLLYGVEYPAGSGQLHYEFELRLPTVRDNIEAIQAVGVESNLQLNLDMFARTLVRLGTIPSEAITLELLEGMVDDDYDVLAQARSELKKKRMRPSSTSPASDAPSSLSADTASLSPEPSN